MVVTRFMGGTQAEHIFDTRLAAESHARSLGNAGGPVVVECPVFGATPTAQEVYVASCYDAPLDIHIIEGAYGTYDEANSAAGDRGVVATKRIES
jgi:hypothetical protein